VKFLQHSPWALEFARAAQLYPGDIFDLWPAGIDTDEWAPVLPATEKAFDVLIYNKIMWDKKSREGDLLRPIRESLARKGLRFSEISYGKYRPSMYKEALSQARTMLFVCEHESQGLAYQEALSSGIPVLAWDQGAFLDPARFRYGLPNVPATSVPFFDERCGSKFSGIGDFEVRFAEFFDNVLRGRYRPRDFILENLSLDRSTERMLAIYGTVVN
jgi:glycosyltransferase involved in cell wall biosynthesis